MARRSEVIHFRSLAALSAELKHTAAGGAQLLIQWDGKTLMRLGLSRAAAMFKDVADAAPEDLMALEDGDDAGNGAAMRMARAYEAVRLKYTGQQVKIRPDGKFWKFMVRAAEMADEIKVDYDLYCEALTDMLSKLNPEGTVRVPWPSQLVSEKAPLWVGDYVAGTKRNPKTEGIRRARAMAGVPLHQDDEYKAVRRRMTNKKHTLRDYHYMAARQREIYGEEKPWLARYMASATDAPQKQGGA